MEKITLTPPRVEDIINPLLKLRKETRRERNVIRLNRELRQDRKGKMILVTTVTVPPHVSPWEIRRANAA